jgi:prepilin-type N-terminal cleavage/methylation domain-containing protein
MSRCRVTSVPHQRARRGVTLVELIVAMSILTIGLLAVAGVSGSIARSLGESRGETLAATAAMARFELIAGTQCSSLLLDSWTTTATRGVTEKYNIVASGNNTLLVTDSVSWVNRRGTRRAAFTTLLPCRTGA